MRIAFALFSLLAYSYEGKWFYKCESWGGPGRYDCVVCISNSHQVESGTWECNFGYSGSYCRNYTGRWAPLCADWLGPGYSDCLNCIDKAIVGYSGRWECLDGFSGDSWTSSYSGYQSNNFALVCNSKCLNGCTGPNSNDCVTCVIHSHRDNFGYCVCDQYWYGDTCQFFEPGSSSSDCHPIWYAGWNGPSPLDCIDCAPNAHRDPFGYCVWNKNWHGEKWDRFYAENKYKGEWHPHCLSDCTGPEAKDCTICVKNAHKSVYGYCVWDEGFFGNDCGFTNSFITGSYKNNCKAICINGCNGPTAKDWVSCMPNSRRDLYGYCICDPDFSGEDCSIFIGYQGSCDLKCGESTCTGPTSKDWQECVENSVRREGDCVCKDHWHGSACTDWKFEGVCDPKCDDCVGPNPSDCLNCVSNAFWSINGCECDAHYEGPDWSVLIYKGQWDAKCDGCIGPKANEWLAWVENAESNKYSYCLCKPFWSGPDCSIYEKECNPMWLTCAGPFLSDCIECVTHSQKDEHGSCVCDRVWAGDSWRIFVGDCYVLCDSCTGPLASDCRFCKEHATEEFAGNWVWERMWQGDLWDTYIGQWESICNGWTGPTVFEWEYCIQNALPTPSGSWVWDYYWIGPSCNVYGGPCDDLWQDCIGPDVHECLIWVENAHFHKAKECLCDLEWTGQECHEYIGTCPALCGSGCSGPEEISWHSWVTHAFRDLTGVCRCSDNWRGSECALWGGICDLRWEGCTGPTSNDCHKCTTHSSLNSYGQCEWDMQRDGADCKLWSGAWDPRCEGCFGQTNADCVRCVFHSHYDASGHCQCELGWTGEQCSIYVGECFGTCQTCVGPLQKDCVKCSDTSFRNEYGLCSWQNDWVGEDCSLYAGSWDFGCLACSGAQDCITCVGKAESVSGLCQCIPGWGGVDCDTFFGDCPALCASCLSQLIWSVWIEHSTLSQHTQWEWEDDWGEGDCSTYNGICHDRCDNCRGPSVVQCVAWVENAHRAENGSCECLEHWSGVGCAVYRGICHPSWDGCTSPNETGCVSWAGNSIMSPDGVCKWEKAWLGSDCGIWGGEWNIRCDLCHGPNDTDWIQWISHSVRGSNGGCVCAIGWRGETWHQEIYECHKTCADCHGKKMNDCDECIDGFTLVDGYCLACHEKCELCDGVTISDCLACAGNRTLSDGGSWICCGRECQTCSDLNVWSSCRPDIKLKDGRCECLGDMVRSPINGICSIACPTGRHGKFCEETSGVIDLNLEFEVEYEGIELYSCHPPTTISERGVWFNGSTSHLTLTPFEADLSFCVRIWARLQETNASLMTFDQQVVDVESFDQDYELECTGDSTEHLSQVTIDMWLSPCHSYVVDIGGFRIKMDENVYDRDKWAEIMLVVAGQPRISHIQPRTQFMFSLNGQNRAAGIWPSHHFYKTIGDLHIGSYQGLAFHATGIIHSFAYFNGLEVIISHAEEWVAGHYSHPSFTDSAQCDWNQYWNYLELSCSPCHPSCINGCRDGQFCVEWDETCAECSGPDAEQCTTCWWGAELESGRCTCSEGGHPDFWEIACPEGCEVWNGTVCIVCKEGYELAEDYTPGECVECQNDFWHSTSIRKPAGSCSCQIGQWFDGTYCRECPENCANCNPIDQVDWQAGFVCTSCKQGYLFAQNSDTCLSFWATGFRVEGQRWVGPSGVVGEWNFAGPVVDWISDGEWDDKTHTWSIEIVAFGGAELPFAIDDRGLWFDGKNNVAKLEALSLHHTFTIDTWMKPHANGCLFSFGWTWWVDESSMSLIGSEVWVTDKGLNQFYWMNAGLTSEWNNHVHQTTVTFWRDGIIISQLVTHQLLITQGYEVLGAKQNGVEDLYRGFMFTLQICNEAVGSFRGLIQIEDCKSDVSWLLCPAVTGECPGFCNWNHFWNGSRCQRCPLFCRSGCQKSGSC